MPFTSKKSRTSIWYGNSGIGKTNSLAQFARWYHGRTGKTVRLISADGGGWVPFEEMGLIDSGVVDPFDISYRTLALADIRRLSEGYWPRVKKGKSGDVLTFRSDDAHVTDWSKANVGCYLIEGASSISKLWLNHIRAQGNGLGFKAAYQIEEDGYNISGLSEGHYSIVQQELYKVAVQGFATLPLDYVIWTALVGKGEDKRTKATGYGPKGAGSADTLEIPSWFGECFHLDRVRVSEEVGGEDVVKELRVAWFQDHVDRETEIVYLAKSRVGSENVAKLEAQYPNGFVPLKAKRGLDRYYEFCQKLSSGVGVGSVVESNVTLETAIEE